MAEQAAPNPTHVRKTVPFAERLPAELDVVCGSPTSARSASSLSKQLIVEMTRKD